MSTPGSTSNLSSISSRSLSLSLQPSYPYSSGGQQSYLCVDNGLEVYWLIISLILMIFSEKIIYNWQLLLQFYICKTWATENETDFPRVTLKMEYPRWEWMKPQNCILRQTLHIIHSHLGLFIRTENVRFHLEIS